MSIVVFHHPGVRVVALCVVGFIEDKEVHARNADERMHHAIYKDLCCAHNDHVGGEELVPGLLLKQRLAHGA
jgi:hypothetical protein